MSDSLFEHHLETLQGALKAIRERTYWSAYPEIPSGKIYGESAKQDGLAAFEARLNKPFKLDQPCEDGAGDCVGNEFSPYGKPLGVTYPKPSLDTLLPAAVSAQKKWGQASVEVRVGICLEILSRLNKQSFELANAVMHTTGQSFMMAFQAGGPHAQDRGLEAVAYAYEAMKRCPTRVSWEKKVSKTDVVRLDKRFHLLPRGVAALIGCSTFPTWNGYPGLFASLATGNAVVLKPHPGAVLPLAITIETARAALQEQGFDPNLVTLAADEPAEPIARALVTNAGVGIVDYTGNSAFGEWIEENAKQAVVFTEKAGINSVVLDSVDDIKAVTGNLAVSICLYAGQMCTSPQNIFISKDGVRAGDQHLSFEDAAQAVVGAVNWLLGDAKRAAELLGAIQNPATVARIEQVRDEGGVVLRASERVESEAFPEARIHSPIILQVSVDQAQLFMREMFGPIVYIVETDSTKQSIELAARTARKNGSITASVYSTDSSVIHSAVESLSAAGVAVSCNLTGQIYMNQSAAFSDFHVSGANPSGTATLCDEAFVASRFRVIQSRVQV